MVNTVFYIRLSGNCLLASFCIAAVFKMEFYTALMWLVGWSVDSIFWFPYAKSRAGLLPTSGFQSVLTLKNALAFVRWLLAFIMVINAGFFVIDKGFTAEVMSMFVAGLFIFSPLDSLIFDGLVYDPEKEPVFSRDEKTLIVAARCIGFFVAFTGVIAYDTTQPDAADMPNPTVMVCISIPLLLAGPVAKLIMPKRRRIVNIGSIQHASQITTATPGIVRAEPPAQPEVVAQPTVDRSTHAAEPKKDVPQPAQVVVPVVEPVVKPSAPQKTKIEFVSPPVTEKDSVPIDRSEPQPQPKIEPLLPPVIPKDSIAEDLKELKAAFTEISTLAPQKRGYAFQDFLNKLFYMHHFASRTAFRITGEEIDGSFEIESQIYLLEAKWHAKPCGQADLLTFNGKVEGKSTWARGIFISYSGFSTHGLEAFARGKRTSIIGMDGDDILQVLDGKISLIKAIKGKARRAVETNSFFVPVAELIH